MLYKKQALLQIFRPKFKTITKLIKWQKEEKLLQLASVKDNDPNRIIAQAATDNAVIYLTFIFLDSVTKEFPKGY